MKERERNENERKQSEEGRETRRDATRLANEKERRVNDLHGGDDKMTFQRRGNAE